MSIDKQVRQVQRYASFGVDVMEWAEGSYVKYSDYLALMDELEASEHLIDILRQDKDKVIDMSTERVTKLLARADVAEKRIAELEALEFKPVAWMRSANTTSFMSRFTTDGKYAVEQWGDDAVALYSLPVAFIPACFTDERNLMHINDRGRETSLIWSEQNSDSGDIKLFRIAAGIQLKVEE